MSFDVIIVGAGPGGLACAEITASHGLKTLVLERKNVVGKKVCAGGVTWNGLVKRVPLDLFERQFDTQHIHTRSQNVSVSSPTPIIATINRVRLGEQMCHKAQQAGAEIRLGCQVTSITDNVLTFLDKSTRKLEQQKFTYLVGADGSSSVVRRHLGLPVHDIGIGINYQLPGNYPHMEWHLNSALFSSGYSWIFPHKETVSVGAYADARVMQAKKLKDNLLKWSEKSGFPLSGYKAEAEYINFDYRGYHFDNIFLVGDAAGLASGLTGEGIYPAIVSGETVARCLINPQFNAIELQSMIKNHTRHRKMVWLLGKNKYISTLLAELVTFSLKKKLINFSAAEMAN
jgi:geranylgeranyl reductase family protein